MVKGKTIKAFLVLGALLFSIAGGGCATGQNSAVSNSGEENVNNEKLNNDFFIEIYDNEIIAGEGEIEKFFQLTNEDKQESKIEIKETILLNEEKCTEEYYEEHKDEYPKISTTLIHFDGNEYIYSYNEQEPRVYQYLKSEKIFYTVESADAAFHTEYYLVNDDNITYSSYMEALFDSSKPANFYSLVPVKSVFGYKEIKFCNSILLNLSIKKEASEKMDISAEENDKLFNFPGKLLCFIDSLKWERYIESLDFSYENYVVIDTERTLVSDDKELLSKLENDNCRLTYEFDLKNAIVFVKSSDGTRILYAQYDKIDFQEILNNFNIFIE
ncbi:MAG: hypothetical protein IJ308_02470 [Clostridia bacterium]|nr:hypothetical protein [Clostridia bacterium]